MSDLTAWLNFLSPEGPCLDYGVTPIPGSPVSLSMIDAICEHYVCQNKPRSSGPLRVLEVGSWIGTSTIAFGNALRRLGVSEYLIYSCDMWHHFGVIRFDKDTTSIANQRNSFNHEIFKHNVGKAIGLDHVIEIIGDSRISLDGLRDSYFDIAYIDGFHGYTVTAADIRSALRLCRLGGIICGDDYDCTAPMLAAISAADREKDHHVLPSGFGSHPGVVQAVNEILGTPMCYGTFWAFENSNQPQPLDVSTLPRKIPTFVPPHLHASFEQCFAAPHGIPDGHPFGQRGRQTKVLPQSAA